jgi:hypothetical protein
MFKYSVQLLVFYFAVLLSYDGFAVTGEPGTLNANHVYTMYFIFTCLIQHGVAEINGIPLCVKNIYAGQTPN